MELAKPETDPEQLRRWGGDVQIWREGKELRVMIASVGKADKIMTAILATISRLGIVAAAEEI